MQAALTRGVGTDERWHVRKSGERFWANGEMTPIRDGDGTPIGFVKVLRDRTEQHRAAEALRQSEERLHRAQKAGGVGTFSSNWPPTCCTARASSIASSVCPRPRPFPPRRWRRW